MDQNFIEFGGEFRGSLLHRFPFRQNDGDLDKRGGIDIEIDPCFCGGVREDPKEKNKRNEPFRHHLIR
jgi:hypothetical protein